LAFNEIGVEIEFKGTGIEEKAFVVSANNPAFELETGKEVLAIHPRYFRPSEVELLIGDATKAKTKLGWKPKYNLEDMVKEMMSEELINQVNL
jgi:GDPmannose 4,6-dehydratase